VEAYSHARAKKKLLALFDLLASSLCCGALILMIYMLRVTGCDITNHTQKLENPYVDTVAPLRAYGGGLPATLR
jgi:hypothetical protein